ncbi:sensor histidine kinase [Aquimarina rhabdastrellae]
MIALLKKYKGFLIGLIVTKLLITYLISIDRLLIDESERLINIIGFLFWWLIISIPFQFFSFFKKHRLVVFKILGILAIFIMLIVVDSIMNIPDNPATICLLITLFFAITYLITPKFFHQYKTWMIVIYVLILGYFVNVRLFSESMDYYINQKKSFALSLFFIPLPFIMALWLYEQYKWVKSIRSEKTKAELALLKSQVNPHFFFNTLNNLYALSVKNSPKAPEVILKLSDMMRYTIYEGKKDWVTLSEEIEYLQNYIELHQIRYHQKIDISFIYEGDTSLKVTPLLFIILLENAFKHGAETLTKDAFIHLSLSSSGDKIIFKVINNFDPESTSKTVGIGLQNLKHRLALVYPKKHILTLEQHNEIHTAILTLETNA